MSLIEYQLGGSPADIVIDSGLAYIEGSPYFMATLSFVTEPSGGSLSMYIDHGDGVWREVTLRSIDRQYKSGTKILFAGPMARLRYVLTNTIGGSGGVLRLFPLHEWPTAGAPEGLYTGLRAITTQSYTECNVKRGAQFELSTLTTLPASGVSNYGIKTGAKPVVLKGRAISVNGLGVRVEFFKGSVYAGGVALTPYNLNTTGAFTSSVIISGAPLVSNHGTKVGADRYVLGNDPSGNNVISATAFSDSEGIEVILAANTFYCFKTTSLDTNPQTVYSYNTWYEGDTDLP